MDPLFIAWSLLSIFFVSPAQTDVTVIAMQRFCVCLCLFVGFRLKYPVTGYSSRYNTGIKGVITFIVKVITFIVKVMTFIVKVITPGMRWCIILTCFTLRLPTEFGKFHSRQKFAAIPIHLLFEGQGT